MIWNIFRSKKNEKIKSEEPKNTRKPDPMMTRGYAAGKPSESAYGWTQRTVSEDADIYRAFTALRAKSRDLRHNDSIVKNYAKLIEFGVVGKTGFKLKVLGRDTDGTLDIVGNTAVQRAWEDFCKSKNCDLNKKRNLRDICAAVITTTAIDGECLIRIVRSKASADSKYGIQLQVLDSDRMDHLYNADLQNGNYIRMGVEINQFGAPVAYHLKKYSNKSTDYAGGNYMGDYERVPANDLVHFFKMEAAEQTRGIPWTSAVILDLKDLGQFGEACVIAGKVGASSSIMLERSEEISIDKIANGRVVRSSAEGEEGINYQQPDELDYYYNEVGAGQITVLPKGVKAVPFTPGYPADAFATYYKKAGQKIAAGLGVSPLRLFNDLEDLNYSTSRTVMQDENYSFEVYQNLMIDTLLTKVYESWLMQAMLNKKIFLKPGLLLPIEKMEKFMEYRFIGRAFGYVDPSVEVETAVMEYKLGIKSLTEILAEQGKDLREVSAQYKQDFLEISSATGFEINGEELIRKIYNGEMISSKDK